MRSILLSCAIGIILPSAIASRAESGAVEMHVGPKGRPLSVSLAVADGIDVFLVARDDRLVARLPNGKSQVLFRDEEGAIATCEDRLRIRTGDFNLDGYTDVGMDTSCGYAGVNVFTSLFFWQRREGRFSGPLEVSNLELHPQRRELKGNMKSGPLWYRSIYRFDGGRPYLYQESEVGLVEVITTRDPSGRIVRKIVVDAGLVEDDPLKPAVLVVSAGRAWLYSAPDEKARTRAYLVAGDEVEVLDSKDHGQEWFKVRYRGKKEYIRWMRSRFLTRK